MLAEGGKTWFLLVADYAFGHQMAHDLRTVISAGGGQVVGEALHTALDPGFILTPMPAAAVKGFTEPMVTYAVEGRSADRERAAE